MRVRCDWIGVFCINTSFVSLSFSFVIPIYVLVVLPCASVLISKRTLYNYTDIYNMIALNPKLDETDRMAIKLFCLCFRWCIIVFFLLLLLFFFFIGVCGASAIATLNKQTREPLALHVNGELVSLFLSLL